jgi:hypothetical protein
MLSLRTIGWGVVAAIVACKYCAPPDGSQAQHAAFCIGVAHLGKSCCLVFCNAQDAFTVGLLRL